MTGPAKPRTAAQNGRLWGARAEDWANIQEGQFSSAYDAVFDACSVGAGTRYPRCENSSEDALDDAHTAALAPFQAKDGSFRISASFKWLLASV